MPQLGILAESPKSGLAFLMLPGLLLGSFSHEVLPHLGTMASRDDELASNRELRISTMTEWSKLRLFRVLPFLISTWASLASAYCAVKRAAPVVWRDLGLTEMRRRGVEDRGVVVMNRDCD